MNLFYIIINQLLCALEYVPRGCVLAFIVSIIWYFIKFKKWRKESENKFHVWIKILIMFMLVTYGYCVLQLTLFSREIQVYDSMDWSLLRRWKESNWAKAQLINNGIMFLPLGVFLPILAKWARYFRFSIPFAIGCSCIIEWLQLKYNCGMGQIDDIFANSIGYLIGFMFFRLINYIITCKKGENFHDERR